MKGQDEIYVIFHGSVNTIVNDKMTEYNYNFCNKGETSSKLQSI